MSGALALSSVGDELLDDPAADPRTVEASLRDIAVANRWLGGTAAALHGIARVLGDLPRGSRVTLLEIGRGPSGGLVSSFARRRCAGDGGGESRSYRSRSS